MNNFEKKGTITVPVSNGLLLDLDANYGIELEDGDRIRSWQNNIPNS